MISDNDEELLLVLDENGDSIDTLMTRSDVHKNKLFHNETTIFIINKDNILLERRSANKRLNPLKLCAPGGHVLARDDIKESALKEVKEETGLELEYDDIHFITRFKKQSEKQNCYQSVFYTYTDKPINYFIKQDSEVEELLYMNVDDFLSMSKDKESEVMYDYYEEKKLFDILEKIVKEGV